MAVRQFVLICGSTSQMTSLLIYKMLLFLSSAKIIISIYEMSDIVFNLL